jgi:peptidoglycan/LPS O-acetylase OafA/YrhL
MNTPEHNNFTVLRLTLALLVALGHFMVLPGNEPARGLFGYADFAVDTFFVVSGYLIFASFDGRPALIDFYIRRLFRIYPLYIAVVIVQGIAMASMAGGISAHSNELLRYFGLNLIMANFLAHDIGGLLSGMHNPSINPSLWTLKIELAFYFVLPLLWYLTERFGAWFLAIVFAASTLYTLVMLHFGMDTLAKQLPGQMRFFIAGMAIARYRHGITLPTLPILIAACGLLALWSTYPHAPAVIALYPIISGVIMYVCVFRLPYIPLKHDISYGVYLLHGPLIQFSLLLGIFSNTTAFLLALLAAVILLALAAERFIEQPGIDLGKWLVRSWVTRFDRVGA